MNKQIKVLLVEDSPSDAELVKREINYTGMENSFMVVENRDEYSDAIKTFNPDIILSDFSLPTFDGLNALQLKREMAPDIPFILVTGSNNEEVAVECMKAGAEDYILKDNLKRLQQAFKAALYKREIIIQKKEAEEKLSILSRAVEQNPALIMITTIDGTIEYVNPRFSETTGYSSEEVIGKNPRILKSGNQSAAFYRDLWETVLAGKEWTGEMLNRKKNHHPYWANVRISPMVNESGTITHLVAIMEDITEKRHMIQDLISAKNKAEAADKLKSAFISNISHEVRTPLNGIIGFSEMMVDDEITETQKQNYNEIIRKCGTRLLNTINSYMDSSLIVSGNMEAHSKPFDITELLSSLKDEFAERCNAKDISLSVQEQGITGEIKFKTDQELLRKTLTYLLDNAVKFTSTGSISFGFRYKPGIVEFFVTDTGCGIDNDMMASIFDYFTQGDTSQTRNYEGSGLGLSIARGLVTLLGGTIRVESTIAKGSSFYFSLPDTVVVSGSLSTNDVVKSTEEGVTPVILVAEDDEFNYKYLEIILKRSGYIVLHALDGQVAVSICRDNPKVSLILMDMKMPVMGGLEATREIRTFMPDIPIIAQTAYVSSADENDAYQAGCNHFLSKPVSKEKLINLVSKVLGN